MYYTAQPPYALLIIGLLVSLTSGAAFYATLTESAKLWSSQSSKYDITRLQGPKLLFPFTGIFAGACVFLSSGLAVFGFPTAIAYLISLPVTLFVSGLVWSQLGQVLIQLQQGGSKALDLDSWG
ncbi:MAG: hypothetical protein J7545_23135 [Roseofilum sp. SBFL]|uniref:hypothetical protein n=1 Tax=unclassified Roseofilum TaxID=2620099 RepID=UPI001B19FBF9|nr:MULTISPECIES: hypothetical protein [unclassified Roseofilum]MBP0015263.1 hypothetical protein [Roseofilum sp. SID3]MBP0022389.1 hypothetical protein [Roseofilum sp. SID2]MBP0036249.1 hypothetical protein [Roseofilum sp. SID1]MBP0044831.1 hypothetical protein [Roseofilum sp. SBFL]